MTSNDEAGQSDADSGDDAFLTNINARKKCIEELNRYKKKSVKLKTMDASGELNDPLDWWRIIGVVSFPILSKLARRFLAF